LISLIDVLRDYRLKFEWWIGLMLVAPAFRNVGLGRQILVAFESYAFKCGTQRLLFAVLEKNTGTPRFWAKLGLSQGEESSAEATAAPVDFDLTEVSKAAVVYMDTY
jgi:GNAT superfamily N-acetyltransferase